MKRCCMKLLALLALFALVLTGCGTTRNTPSGEEEESVYRMLYGSEFTTLDYLATGNTWELKTSANTIDGLIEYDKYGVIQPSLAEDWKANDDFTEWTFTIRQGAKWVDKDMNEVADVTANDWVAGAKYANDAKTDSGSQYMFEFVVGAMDYYDQTALVLEAELAVENGDAATVEEYYEANEIDAAAFGTFEEMVGVKAPDDYTLVYTLTGPCPFFLSCLSYSAYYPVLGSFLEQVGENFGIDNDNLLYNGAYVLSVYEPNVQHVLAANPTYWDKEHVTIDRIEYTFNADEATIAPQMVKTGETDYAIIGSDILDAWMKDNPDIVRPSMRDISYSYFYAFNFEPRFAEEYEPENWKIAVNNENFRQSLLHALDRVKALTVKDPFDAAALLNNTVTPTTFASAEGKDFTEYGDLAAYTNGDSFDESLAKEYRDKAFEELTAAGAKFPVIAYMPFNPNTTNWDKECQVVEQQIEALLGTDYINIVVEAGPSTGFLSAVRRSGQYAFMKCNWGADYADPQTWTDPFTGDNTYNFMGTNEKRTSVNAKGEDEPMTNKSAETQAIVTEYNALVEAAKKITTDPVARFEAFAEAEALLIEHAIIVPYSVDLRDSGYVSDRIDPFSMPYCPFGLSPFKFKGAVLLDAPMGAEAYAAAREKWQKEMEAAQAAA